MIKTPQDVQRLGTILVLGAHPDDETFIAGGLIAAATANGQMVVCVTATRGEQGTQDEARWPASQLADIRTKELTDALYVLGVPEHHWLSYADGACDQVDEAAAVQAICDTVGDRRFNAIVTFGPDGLTGHPDHQAVSRWALGVAKRLLVPAVYQVVVNPLQYEQYFKPAHDKLNIFFNIEQPPLVQPDYCDICLTLPDALCQKKLAALAAMPSQMARMQEVLAPDLVRKMFAVEAFTSVPGKPFKS